MEDLTLLKGIIQGMESMGAKFVKTDGFHLFFEVTKGSEIDDEEKLKRAKDFFVTTFGLGLKIRKV